MKTRVLITALTALLAAGLSWAADGTPAAAAVPAVPVQLAEACIADPRVTAHDPTLYRDGQGQWVFSTGPGIARFHSRDGRQWTPLPPVFPPERRPAWWTTAVPRWQAPDVWAPKLFEHRDRLWVMYSVSSFGHNTSAIALASVPLADGPGAAPERWRDDGVVLTSFGGTGHDDPLADRFNAIDPDVLRDASGRLWFSWGSWWRGLQVDELDPDSLRPRGAPAFVARRRGGIEAPTLLQRGDWFYLFSSWGVCCKGVDSTYEMRVGRSHQPQGPFVDREGRALMDGGGTLLRSASGRWRGPGHQDVVGDDVVWHAYDAASGGASRLCTGRLRWSDDGWPSL